MVQVLILVLVLVSQVLVLVLVLVGSVLVNITAIEYIPELDVEQQNPQ